MDATLRLLAGQTVAQGVHVGDVALIKRAVGCRVRGLYRIKADRRVAVLAQLLREIPSDKSAGSCDQYAHDRNQPFTAARHRSRSASTIISTSPWKSTSGCQPSSSRAFDESPIR